MQNCDCLALPTLGTGISHVLQFTHGQSALTAFDDGHHPIAESAAAAGFGSVDQLSMVNVAIQTDALNSHPLVADARRKGRLNVIGLFYDIASALVLQVDAAGVSTFDGQPAA